MMESKRSITQMSINLPEGKELETRLVDRRSQPNRYQIGSGMKQKTLKNQPIDALEIMATFTPQEWFVVNTLKEINDLLKIDDNGKRYASCIVSTRFTNLLDRLAILHSDIQLSAGSKIEKDKETHNLLFKL